MTSFADFTSQAPQLAAAVRSRFEAHLHHVVATLRADGSPRVSGTEARFFEDHLYLGSMPGSRKADDLRRDPRMALHAAPVDLELAQGDAKVSGIAVEVDRDEATRFLQSLGNPDVPADGEVFRVDLHEAVLTRVEGDELRIDTWRSGAEPRTIRRS
ncbi:MAG: pyridoxamine 5'-phosphate oxidase family protein [Acidimicrobiales bacterium]